jgi:arylsulfatase A-like enzyme
VIFIMADDLGYADVGCYGQQKIHTPHIDSLARDGLKFTQVYAGSTVCAPSRCCLITGKHTGHATVRGNAQPHVPLTRDEMTLGEVFKNAGYATGIFGKWGLATPPDDWAYPTRRGFDTFFGYLHQVHAHTYYPDMLWDNEREFYMEANFSGRNEKYSHDVIAERALRFIDDHHDEPFFLYAPFTPPHGRFEVPSQAPYENEPWDEVARIIAAMITRLDASVGDILASLKKHGIERDTLVVFTSDNGPGALATKRFDSNGPLRGVKRDLYEGGIREPFIARWPGRIEAGKTSDAVFTFWDMLPSFAELTGQPIPEGIDGVSVLMAMLGEGPVPDPDRVLYWEFHERGFQQAVRWRDWKGVRQELGGPVEVYDLAADPGEEHDLAASKPDIAAKLGRMIDEARTPSPYWPKKR